MTASLWGADQLDADYSALGSRGEADRDRERKSHQRAKGREIVVPECADPERRAACERSLERFAVTYFPALFYLALSPVHHLIFESMETAILGGGRVALAAPRGFGKTTIAKIAVLWAVVYGHARYVVLVCAAGADSVERLDEIKEFCEADDENPLFAADFPEVCAPVRALEQSPQRAGKQTHKGKYTRLRWGSNLVQFARIEGAPAAGSIITTRGLDAAIRGLVRGDSRPDLVLCDDPQTEESARSEYQTTERKKILGRAIEGLVGPGRTLTIIGLWTVIEHGDLAHQYTSGSVPGYRPLLMRTIQAWPENMVPAERYIELRRSARRGGDRDARGPHAWYLIHQDEIERGAIVSWPENFNRESVQADALELAEESDTMARARRERPDDLYAIELSNFQRCLNLIADLGDDGWNAFRAEYQNEPPEPEERAVMRLTMQAVQEATSGYPRGVVPPDAVALVEGRDVGRYRIHWVVQAVLPGRRMVVVDYGEEPVDSPSGRVEHGTVEGERQQMAIESAILQALRAIDQARHEHPYHLQTGEPMDVNMTLVDSRYGTSTVRRYADEGGQTVQALMGMGTAQGQRKWYVPKGATLSSDGALYSQQERGAWRFYAHADEYKRQVHTGLLLPQEEPGSIRLPQGQDRKEHEVIAMHITAEEEVEIASGVSRWSKVKGRRANHYFDCLCYGLAAVSYISHWIDAAKLSRTAAPATQQKPTKPNTAPRRRRVVEME